MKKAIFVGIGFLILTGCNQPSKEDTASNNSENISNQTSLDTIIETDINKIEERKSERKIEKIDFNFLSDCDSLEMWSGGIQGVSNSDSTGVYIMAECSSNKHFDLIIFSEKEIDLKEGTDYKQGIIKNGLIGVEYYAFEIPKKDPENEFDTYDYIFPSEVKVYKLFDDGWYLIMKKNIESFEQLGRLKLNSIYKK